MPFKAEADGRAVWPAVASRDMALTCPECNDPLTLVRRHERAGTFVASHFRHLGESGDGSGGPGGCGGESPTHEKMKSIAADRLRHDLGDIIEIAELHIDTKYVGERLPDVLAVFESPVSPYGKGIAVECQYRNEGKDREATEEAYLDEEITTLWLEEDAFDLDSLDVDLSRGERVTVWPNAVREPYKWPGLTHEIQERSEGMYIDIHTPLAPGYMVPGEATVPATIPDIAFAEGECCLWESPQTPGGVSRERVIDDHPKAVRTFVTLVPELVAAPETHSMLLKSYLRERETPRTIEDCAHSTSDDYRPGDRDAMVCWECSTTSPRPRKLNRTDDPEDVFSGGDVPCIASNAEAVNRALGKWRRAVMASLGEQESEQGVASVDWSPGYLRTHLGGLSDGPIGYSFRSSVIRIAYAATLEALFLSAAMLSMYSKKVMPSEALTDSSSTISARDTLPISDYWPRRGGWFHGRVKMFEQ